MEIKLTLHFFFLITFYLIQPSLEAQDPGEVVCSELNISASVTPACVQGSAGEVTLTVTQGMPPYQIKWFDGSATASRKLPSGEYHVLVTDALGCEQSTEVTIPRSAPLQVMAQVNHTSKIGKSNGQIDLNISGGMPPYRYTWISSQQGILYPATEGVDRVRKVPAGLYQILVFDASGCYVEVNTEVK